MKKAVIFGSGGLRIGQAGEFDYSGSQAIKALQEENIYTVLINPNIATVQTDRDMADRVYFQPLNVNVVTKILEQEKPDIVLLSFGGQTALNLGLQLEEKGIFRHLNITVLGTPVNSIRITEDRALFKEAMSKIGTKTARSLVAYNLREALSAAKDIGYPVMMRSGFSLGGLGSGRINNDTELKEKASQALSAVSQVLIEEFLVGWKEIEYEVVRDMAGNTVTVCNMENLDPMGIHTGESVVVAPSQTLTNKEYHHLREIAIKSINHLKIIGECNIQYALNPQNGDYRVIEVNARLSRSSALASKATGYPLAFVATKLMLGKRLHELKNSVTGTTPAFYEPALDYLALKIPRWDLSKLKSSDHAIGSEMKSVGEVMALGRSFPEVLQKAIRMLNIGAQGLSHHPYTFTDPLKEVEHATDRRLFALYEALKKEESVDHIHALSGIDTWFLHHIKDIALLEKRLSKTTLKPALLLEAKRAGFSDKVIGELTRTNEMTIRKLRMKANIRPAIKQIDTLAGEFAATTNYLYTTYYGDENDIRPLGKKAVIVLGSGPYCIGSSVEFDWCAVNTGKTLSAHGLKTIMINSNPETVSTDFDRSDRLYFEELTLERIKDIADFERPKGVVVSVGGQIANNLALPLHKAGYPVLGTPPPQIDQAEDRKKFSAMLNKLGIDQPAWQEVSSLKSAKTFADRVGYPVIIRPSYVLSGGAMNVAVSEAELDFFVREAAFVSQDHPVVISKFVTNAKEIEIDGVAKDGRLVIFAISEHIENAGVHSGDATVVFPAQRLYLETVRQARFMTRQIIANLKITGPFNIQFIAKDNEIKVIECNVRASRSFPFVSKVTGHNFITIAAETMLNIDHHEEYKTLDYDYVAVKSPQFSYNRLKGADPVAGVEMASTGEVACFGDNIAQAFYRSWLATEQYAKKKALFLSLPDEQKHKFIEVAAALLDSGWKIYTTIGTHRYLKEQGIETILVHKIIEKKEPGVASIITKQRIGLAICIPSTATDNKDAYKIRRLTIDSHIPLLTNAETGRLLMHCLSDKDMLAEPIKAWQDYVGKKVMKDQKAIGSNRRRQL
jgi:carbamoyl-phosphate synthase large subunit